MAADRRKRNFDRRIFGVLGFIGNHFSGGGEDDKKREGDGDGDGDNKANKFSTMLQEEWKKMMEKEEEEVPKPLPPLLPLPLEFCSPPWFDYNCHRNERVPGEICWHHGCICLPVRYSMRRLRRQSLKELEEELDVVAEKLEEEEEDEKELQKERGRYIKISALREKQWEEGLKEKKKDEEERKFMRRKRRYKRKNKYARRIKVRKRRFTFEDFLQLADPKRPNANDTSTRFWTFVQDVKAYNLPDLSGKTTHRDYLINNKGVQVDIKQQLSGKYVLLYFWYLPDDSRTKSRLRPKPPQRLHGYLEELYTIYRPKEEFEIMLVPLGENEIFFRYLFSLMPWLAIPHEDKVARDFFHKRIQYSIPVTSKSCFICSRRHGCG